MGFKTPLPPNYFLQPPLTAAQRDTFIRDAQDITRDIIAMTHLNPSNEASIQWRRDLTDDGNATCAIYKGVDPTAPPGVISYLATMQLEATLEEVSALFAAHTQEELHEYRRVIAPDMLDIHQLYVLATPTDAYPNRLISIKYSLMKGAAPTMRRRDFCFLDSNLDFECDGRRGFARAMRSIELPCVPNFEETFNIVRAYQHRGGFVFVQSDTPGYLDAFQLYQVDPKGKVPTWLADLAMKTHCRNFQAMARIVHESRLSRVSLLSNEQVVPKSSRDRCFLCFSKFRVLFNRKARCRKCGEVMCHRCAQLWSVKVQDRVRRVRICRACSAGQAALSSQSSWTSRCLMDQEDDDEELQDQDDQTGTARCSLDDTDLGTSSVMESLSISAKRMY